MFRYRTGTKSSFYLVTTSLELDNPKMAMVNSTRVAFFWQMKFYIQ